MTGELVLKKIAQQILFPFRNISLTVLDVSLVFSDFFFFWTELHCELRALFAVIVCFHRVYLRGRMSGMC